MYRRNSEHLFKHTERLVGALRILRSHELDLHNYYNSLLKLQANSNNICLLIKETFKASVSERRGASFNRGKNAVSEFESAFNNLVKTVESSINNNPEQAHKMLFETLVMLKNVDQKITAMFIKFLAVYKKVWPSLLPYLYVPIDRVVIKMLKDKMKVYIGQWEQSPSVKNAQGNLYIKNNIKSAQYDRFELFQNELSYIARKANVPRVLIDELWFVGICFCKQYPLCNQCWIKEFCQVSR